MNLLAKLRRRPPCAPLLIMMGLLLQACAEMPFAGDGASESEKIPSPAQVKAPAKPLRIKETPAPDAGPAIPLTDEARRRLAKEDRLSALMGPGPQLSETPLIGLEGKAVVRLLGAPGFIHRDPPAQIWRYTGAECRLDLFLYRQGEEMKVTHAEARGKQIDQTEITACLRQIIKARAS